MCGSCSDLDTRRHSLAHILAQAVERVYPDAKKTIGPAVENGFYFDFDFGDVQITDADLSKFEKEMKKIISGGQKFVRYEMAIDAALVKARETEKNSYKEEILQDLKTEGTTVVSYYKNVDQKGADVYEDLCRGPHMEHTGQIPVDCFKLSKIAGAYWRGDAKNKMLTRIYGLAFENKAELDAHLTFLEEAKRRDHRVLGKKLKLFTVSDLVGAGLPLLQPAGMTIRKAIEDYLWELHKTRGYQRVWTPHLAKEDLYVTSGHAGHYLEDMFSVFGGTSKEKFHLKPMSCPHHMQIFADNQFSYRDMPVRYFEPATVYRDEKTGQLSGLTRVRSITQDDGHLFCRVNQIEQEVSTIVEIIKTFYGTMGMLDGYWVRLSVRGADKSTYLGGDDVWNTAEAALKSAAEKNALPYKLGEGEAAFYGPKLDFMFKDAIGREWQLATIQCDFNLPERFKLEFTNEKGEKERPVVIHRAISGSLERFMGVMIEHFAGDFPLWLSPVQAIVVPVSEKFDAYAQEVLQALRAEDIRAEMDLSSEGLGKKIRNAEQSRIPYMLVVGEKEVTEKTVAVRSRKSKDQTSTELHAFVAQIKKESSGRFL